MVDSSFCAGTVPSQVSGGFRHVSQFPHAIARSEKYASSCDLRHSVVSHKPSIESRWDASSLRCARLPSEESMSRRCCTTSASP